MVWYSRVYRPTRHIIGHFKVDFMGCMTPTNSVTALKDNVKGNPTRLSLLKGKEKDVRKNFKICLCVLAPRRPKTQRHLEDRELNQARSKPDTVVTCKILPVRTAHTFVHHYNSTQYSITETVFFQYSPSTSFFLNIPFEPFPPDHDTSQTWSSGGKGGYRKELHCKSSRHGRLWVIFIWLPVSTYTCS